MNLVNLKIGFQFLNKGYISNKKLNHTSYSRNLDKSTSYDSNLGGSYDGTH